MATILLIDDDTDQQETYRINLPGHTLLQAKTSGEARRLFAAHQGEIDLIIFDYGLSPSDEERTTVQLVHDIRAANFPSARMVAATTMLLDSEELREAGCGRGVPRKSNVENSLVEHLLSRA